MYTNLENFTIEVANWVAGNKQLQLAERTFLEKSRGIDTDILEEASKA